MMTGPTEQESKPRGKKGVFRRFREWLFGESERRDVSTGISGSPVVVQPERSERHSSTEPFLVPTCGGVFEFRVHYDCVWKAKGLSQSVFSEKVSSYSESAAKELYGLIWSSAREVRPNRPEEAEVKMNELVATAWCYEEGDLSCRATLRVEADPRVVAKQLPLWERIIEMDQGLEVEQRRIEIVGELLDSWQELLKQHSGPLPAHAAKLVENPVAEVLGGLSMDRVVRSGQLIEVLRQARDTHAGVGLYEFATAYDAALRSLEREAGLDPGRVAANSRPAPLNGGA